MLKKFLIASVLSLLLANLTFAQTPPPAPPLPQPGPDYPWYVPGELYKFNSVVLVDGDGNTFSTGTRDVTSGWTEYDGFDEATRANFVAGKFRGDANLWFSGNAAIGYSSSTLTKNKSQASELCARINDFRVTGTSGHSINCTTGFRTVAWDWVTSPSLVLWSGCTIVVFDLNWKSANLNTGHWFSKNSGGVVAGVATSHVGYRCLFLN